MVCGSREAGGAGAADPGGAATGAFPAWDLSRLRYCGVLQRIALCFMLVSAAVLYLPQTPNPRLQVAPPFPPSAFPSYVTAFAVTAKPALLTCFSLHAKKLMSLEALLRASVLLAAGAVG